MEHNQDGLGKDEQEQKMGNKSRKRVVTLLKINWHHSFEEMSSL